MRGLSAAGIVTAWERAERLAPLDRALAMLWAAGEAADGDDLAALPLAERDRRLLALREATFGERLDCIATCPDCGAELEFVLSVPELIDSLPAPEAETIERDGVAIAIRPLDSRDLAAAVALPEGEAHASLRSRVCPGAESLPAELVTDIDARLEAREAAGELGVSLACADCGASWAESLDVAGHLWAEMATAARRVMAEVAEMAAAFGWSEAEILAMSEARRRTYLAHARDA